MILIKQHVDRLFAEACGPTGELGRNPVTGSQFVWGHDPLAPEKRDACRALWLGNGLRSTAHPIFRLFLFHTMSARH